MSAWAGLLLTMIAKTLRALAYSISLLGPSGVNLGNCGFAGLSLGLSVPFTKKLNPKDLELTDNLMKGGGLEVVSSIEMWAD